jgi:ATP-dependent DNA helicase RecQ
LANYFGEHQALDCGICDHCLEARKKEKPPGFEYYKPLILSQLQEPSNPKKLEEFFKPQQKDDVKKAIRFLLEEEVLVLQSDGTLIRKSDLKKSGFQL